MARRPERASETEQARLGEAPGHFAGSSPSAPPLRPTFALELSATAPEACAALRRRLESPGAPCCGISTGLHAELFVERSRRRAWSPVLSLTFEDAGAGCRVIGRFGPHPAVWTGLMFAAFSIGTAAMLGVLFGLSQWMLETTPWALLAGPAGVSVLLVLYAAGLVGQRLGAGQMAELREALDALLGDARGGRPEEADAQSGSVR